MNQGRIIVITGSPGTGKTTTASIVAKESDMDKSVHISKNANHFYNEQHRQCQYLQYQLHRLNPFLLIILYKGICHNAMMSTLM